MQQTGEIRQARGEVTSETRLESATGQEVGLIEMPDSTLLPVAVDARGLTDAPQSNRIREQQPLRVRPGSSVEVGVGGGPGFQDARGAGTINNFRFEAGEVMFTPEGWEAEDVSITNDPFFAAGVGDSGGSGPLAEFGPVAGGVAPGAAAFGV